MNNITKEFTDIKLKYNRIQKLMEAVELPDNTAIALITYNRYSKKEEAKTFSSVRDAIKGLNVYIKDLYNLNTVSKNYNYYNEFISLRFIIIKIPKNLAITDLNKYRTEELEKIKLYTRRDLMMLFLECLENEGIENKDYSICRTDVKTEELHIIEFINKNNQKKVIKVSNFKDYDDKPCDYEIIDNITIYTRNQINKLIKIFKSFI